MRRYQSRLAEVEERNSVRSAVIFGGLTILIIILAIFFGIQVFSKFTNLFSRSGATPIAENVTLATPNLSPLPQNTNRESLAVSGSGTPNSNIKVYFNDASDTTPTDDSGNFAMTISLTKGSNTIYAKTIDDKGNTSASSTTYTVNFTNQIPNLTVNSPQNNQTFFGDSQKNLKIEGSTDVANSLTVNDHIAILDSAGKFSFPFTLQNGDNNLKIISQDPAGNKKEIDLKVTFNP